MNILRKTDLWIAKTLFHGIAIALCRWLKVSQFRLNRDLWFVGWTILTVSSILRNQTPDALTLFFFVIFFLRAALVSDSSVYRSSLFFRLIIWTLTFVGLMGYLANDGSHVSTVIADFIFLLAEYATTIDTLPPKRKSRGRNDHKYRDEIA